MPKKPCIDHTGREWPSGPEMCEHYQIPYSTYRGRLDRGWTMEQALTVEHHNQTLKVNLREDRKIKDHEGREHESVAAMCRYWKINPQVYQSRRRLLGWPLDKILTEPVREPEDCAGNISVTDHLGRTHPSISAMCRHWHIRLSTYRERRKRGWDIEQALTGDLKLKTVVGKTPCRDHLGNEYPSKSDMCRAHGVTRHCYSSRRKAGWSLERALTEPLVINAKSCEDHMGRKFPAAKDMANFLGLPAHAFQGRKITPDLVARLCAAAWTGRACNGWHVETCPSFPWFRGRYRNRPAMAHFETLLDAYHNGPDFEPLPATNAPHARVKAVKLVKWPWYLCQLDGRPAVLDYWSMIKIHAENNFGLRNTEENA